MNDQQRSQSEIDEYVRRWTEAGLGQYEEELRRLVLPAIELDLEASTDDAIPVGATKLGGRPDLSDASLWPKTKDGRWIAFVAQINLNQMSEFRLGEELPRNGLLSFFADVEEYRNFMDGTIHDYLTGYKQDDADQWRVLYESDLSALHRAEFPADLAARGRCGSASAAAQRSLTMPFPQERSIQQLQLTEDDDDRFYYLCYDRDTVGRARFYGNAAPIQQYMKLMCQLASRGVTDFVNDPRIPNLQRGTDDWQHLFSLDACNDHLAACEGMEFVGDSAIYFLIRKQDLARRDFAKTWMILELG
jgi:uncharacterized protein YwqG